MLRSFLRLIARIFFREIAIRGSACLPTEGPCIIVAAPHANQFVDPVILIYHTSARSSPPRFLIAEKSYHRMFIGYVAKLLHAIPVARPQDNVSVGTGSIYIASASDPCRLTGKNTLFKSELKDEMVMIMLENSFIQVEQVISDTELVLKKPPEQRDIDALLNQDQSLSFKYCPVIDQNQMYEAVYNALDNGECIGIFPEGGSHDRPGLLPLKAGFTIMALGAVARNPKMNLKIIPCGLNYFHPHRFRSRAVVEFGNPISISEDLVNKFKIGGASKREACAHLLDTIRIALKAVTIDVPDYETLQVVQATQRLYTPTRQISLSQKLEITRKFVDGYLRFKDNPQVQTVAAKVLEYNKMLRTYGLKDHQTADAFIGKTQAAKMLIVQVARLVILLLLALPGLLANGPVAIIANYISKKKALEAKNASSVKIAGRDVLATWKLLVALVLVPLLYAIYSLTCFWILTSNKVNQLYSLYYTCFFSLSLPFVSFASVRLAETGFETYSSLRPLFLSLLPARINPAVNIRKTRRNLQKQINNLVDELGPTLFPNLESQRIISKEDIQAHMESENELTQDYLDWDALSDSECDDVFFSKIKRS